MPKKEAEKPNRPQLVVWRGINLFMSVFFFFATLVNVNDDDWFLWTPVYFIPALLCLALTVSLQWRETKLWNILCAFHFMLCLLYAVYQGVLLLQTLAGKVQNPLRYEEGREMAGLLITLAWLGISKFAIFDRPDASVGNKNLWNILLVLTVTLGILPLFLWSLCFISDWHTKIGHCQGMFS